MDDIFSTYFQYVADTEPPINYHRWSLISAIATLIGRKAFFEHGHQTIFPNLYVTLIGEPAARKSTSIKIIKRLVRAAGYENFAADKTSKEKFLLDLEGYIDPAELADPKSRWKIEPIDGKLDPITSSNLWGDANAGEPKEVYIAADEFSEFTGTGNMEFYTTLGNLWDWHDPEKPFVQRLKNSRSVSIYQPTINILSGTTAELFSRIFPPESIGSGFLSRLLLIYGERSGRSIAFPKQPDAELQRQLIEYFKKILDYNIGEVSLTPGAKTVLTSIYESQVEIQDARFKAYSNRRFTQLLKLCLVLCVAEFKKEIDVKIVTFASTILTHAEFLMPKALGEFGKSKNSDVAYKIMNLLENAEYAVTAKEIWKYVSRDLDSQRSMMELLQGLLLSEKIQVANTFGKNGYLPRKQVRKDPKYIDWSLLTEEEHHLAGIIHG